MYPSRTSGQYYGSDDLQSEVRGSQNPSLYSAYGGIGRRHYTSKTFASDTYADLMRDEYRDYKTRFQPYERKLMSLAESEAMLDEQLSRISVNSAQRYKQNEQNALMNMRKYGLSPTQRQSQSFNVQNELSRGLAVSQAKNMSRLAHGDRQMGILSGSGASRGLINQSGQGG